MVFVSISFDCSNDLGDMNYRTVYPRHLSLFSHRISSSTHLALSMNLHRNGSNTLRRMRKLMNCCTTKVRRTNVGQEIDSLLVIHPLLLSLQRILNHYYRNISVQLNWKSRTSKEFQSTLGKTKELREEWSLSSRTTSSCWGGEGLVFRRWIFLSLTLTLLSCVRIPLSDVSAITPNSRTIKSTGGVPNSDRIGSLFCVHLLVFTIERFSDHNWERSE